MRSQHVCILLAAFDGERFIRDQIDSIIKQTHSDWMLVVSCDPSNDRTPDLLTEICLENPEKDIRIVRGPGKGSTANFISMFDLVPDEASFVAFCDQDDVWLEDKLAYQVSLLEHEDEPTMACGATFVANEDLSTMHLSLIPRRPPGFGNALVQNIASGNTIMLNRGAFECLQEAKHHLCTEIVHDWWCYLVVTAMGGRVIYDSHPLVLYRQHTNNQIGQSNDILSKVRRLKRLFLGDHRRRNDRIEESLVPLKDRFLDQNQEILDAFNQARRSGTLRRLLAFGQTGVYRQRRSSQMLLLLSFVLGKL
ncbi:glycosyltransferase [Marivivens marinus]|uniref:glycosyltransferase n=1 Tax=Marivivens marinus TaxID=3110173 RepID=UPI003B84ACE2